MMPYAIILGIQTYKYISKTNDLLHRITPYKKRKNVHVHVHVHV